MRDFQAPRMPGHWNVSEKAFYQGLINVLEEIYSHKVGVNDLDKKLKTKIESAKAAETQKPEWKPLPVDTKNVTIPTGQGCEYCKDGNVVWIVGSVKLVNRLADNTALTIATMPEGFRPHRNTYEMHALGGTHFRLGALNNGEIQITHFNTDVTLSNAYNLPLKIEYVAE